jgi:glycosyltransferase involved in cell wall biosynthesis
MSINLSIIIPCYNEENTIFLIVEKIKKIKSLTPEIIIVDDCSTDNTSDVLKKISQLYPDIKIVTHEKNLGKGAAIRSGINLVTGC